MIYFEENESHHWSISQNKLLNFNAKSSSNHFPIIVPVIFNINTTHEFNQLFGKNSELM